MTQVFMSSPLKLVHIFFTFLAPLVSLVTGSPTSQPNDLNAQALRNGLRLPLERRDNQVNLESLRAHLAQVSA